MPTKLCTKCGKVKDINEFSWSIRGIKRHSRCKSCHSREHSEYYERNKEKLKEYKWDRQVKKKEEARKYVWEYLSKSRCVDCGISDPYVLTFDHVAGKKMGVSQMVNQGYGVDAIRDEISKCEVRCFNCHMKAEKIRRGTIYPSG